MFVKEFFGKNYSTRLSLDITDKCPILGTVPYLAPLPYSDVNDFLDANTVICRPTVPVLYYMYVVCHIKLYIRPTCSYNNLDNNVFFHNRYHKMKLRLYRQFAYIGAFSWSLQPPI